MAIVVAKAIAYPNQSLSSQFFSLINFWAVHLPDLSGRSGTPVSVFMSGKAPSRSSFLTRLHKLFALGETDVAYLCGAHNSILAREIDIRSELCRLSDIRPFKS
jgi:hypothetical protein